MNQHTVEAHRPFGCARRTDPNPPQDHGFMYNRNVEDPDGNAWEVMWMDMGALAQAENA